MVMGEGIIYLPATILGALAQTVRLRETGVWPIGTVTGVAELRARKCSSTTTIVIVKSCMIKYQMVLDTKLWGKRYNYTSYIEANRQRHPALCIFSLVL